MAGSDTVEDMEVDVQEKDEVVIFLSVKWSESVQQQKSKRELQKVFQTWANNYAKENQKPRECTVLDVSEDGKVELKIEPPPAVKELQKLIGQTLSKKDGGKNVTITCVSLTPPELETPKPEEASVDLSPALEVNELQERKGQTLSKKDKKTVTITSVSPTPSKPGTATPEEASGDLLPSSKPEPQDLTMSPTDEQEKKINHRPEDASVDLPPSSEPEPQDVQRPPVEEMNLNSSAAVSTAREETCSRSLPVNHFCYVNHIYAKEIKQIEKINGVTMEAEVTVTFKANQKDGGPQEVPSEFINLVQKCLGESDGSVFPLKNVEPGELKDALRIIQRPENKLLLTLSSEEMIICGPRQNQDAISQSLNLTQKTLTNAITSAEESTRMSEDPPLNIDMSIKDPLVDTGLTMDWSDWKLMKTSYFEKVAKIKAKFDVDFKVSGINQGTVKVKAQYKRSGQNVSLESHAIRALLRLYQEIVTSPKNFPKLLGSMGVRGPPENLNNAHPLEGIRPALNGQSENSMRNTAPENVRNSYQSEGASSGPAINEKSKYSTRNTDAPADEGATAGDNKDEKCPICIDTFTKKTQLKCKHEFCESCLEQSKKTLGSICPVCREVFGMIEGDQPDGHMSWIPSFSSLPGYSNCGSITITYDIPSGTQTEKHPNPGQSYSGVHRIAYLPDNKEGREVLKLLKEAFDRKLIFTIGTSRTTGRDNQVTWNDIHHKTSPVGGPENFGYPDPDYLNRVRDELKAKGIK